MKDYVKEIEAAIERYIPQEKAAEQQLIDAVRYSLNLKGKRVRPSLTLAFAELCGGSVDAAMPFACAVEMVHTYSLIHDDLPCMDNDDFRRGQPTNHKVFGENIALLAGDALQSMAYTAMLSDEAVAAVGGVRAARAAHILAEKSGLLGMVGGQVIDLSMEHKTVDIELVRLMEEKKTANLIEAACMMGCVVAGAEEEKINAAERYAHAIPVIHVKGHLRAVIVLQILNKMLRCTRKFKFLRFSGKQRSHLNSIFTAPSSAVLRITAPQALRRFNVSRWGWP